MQKNILQENLFEEIEQLKKQLEYIRSGEYYNQLRFERDMLQNLVDTGKISAEDKEFIDCTHRNTELLEENEQLQEKISKAIEYIEKNSEMTNLQLYGIENVLAFRGDLKELLEILKGNSNE